MYTVVQRYLTGGIVQIHQQTHILRTRPDWSGQNVSSTVGYVFVPSDPFRATEEELRKKLNKQALQTAAKQTSRTKDPAKK